MSNSDITDSKPLEIVLADDHAVVRRGLRALLEEQGWTVVAEAGDVDAARERVAGHHPDVLVLDLSMPGTISALDLIPLLREQHPKTHIVIVTVSDEPPFVRGAMSGGASAFVVKSAADEELAIAIRAAAAGGRYLGARLGGY